MTPRSQQLDFFRSFLFDPDRDDFESRSLGGFEREQRKPSISGDETKGHST
jgi:hypothetical protein